MKPRTFQLRDGRELWIREARSEDATALVQYIKAVSGESNLLSFGPGEFLLTDTEQAEVLQRYRDTDNGLFLVALIDDQIAGSLNFAAGHRIRRRHCGEFGMSVQRSEWRKGVGSALIDVLTDWAREGGVIKKINLQVRTDNLGGVGLYERKGFLMEGTLSRGICIDGAYFDLHCMGLEI